MEGQKSNEKKVTTSALGKADDDNIEGLELEEVEVAIFSNIGRDLEMDDILLSHDLDENDEQDDGIFLDQRSRYQANIDGNLNREQRRDAQRKRKKKKLPSKGFG